MTLIEQLNYIPPPIVRLLCLLTERELVIKSGLSLSTIRRISSQRSWDKQARIISAFLDAAGIEVRLVIPAMYRVRKIIGSKRGLGGVKHLKRHSQKSQAIKRIMRALK